MIEMMQAVRACHTRTLEVPVGLRSTTRPLGVSFFSASRTRSSWRASVTNDSTARNGLVKPDTECAVLGFAGLLHDARATSLLKIDDVPV